MRTLLIAALAAAVILAAGCQKATFWEQYEKTPVKTSATGAGSSTVQTYKVENAVYLWANGQWYRLVNGQWKPLKEEDPICVPRR
jgi:ABC-type phosphate transport system substrate-binding protein